MMNLVEALSLEAVILTKSNRALALMGAGLISACASTIYDPEAPYVAPTADMFSVAAAFETPLVGSKGDSADDPAIYIGDDGQGFIAGTDKQSGLHIYNLDGEAREFFPLGTVNNVDLRDGFYVDSKNHVLLVASNDDKRNITAMLYDPATDEFLKSTTQMMSVKPAAYGICLGQVGAEFHVGVTTKLGIYYQYILSHEKGGFSVDKVREFSTGTKTEGCVFDDRTQSLYIAEEMGGLYYYRANPSEGDTQTELARIGQYGMMGDLEGVTIYPEGEDGGYLLVSSQGNNSYAAFTLPDHKFKGQFEIVEGIVDRTSVTDGIDVIATPTARFPKGFFVAQDNDNKEPTVEDAEEQNFKIVDWRDIEAGLNQ